MKNLIKARVELQKRKLKKSGKNKYAGFDYFELKDVLPTINEINAELGLMTIFNIIDGVASLEVVDGDKSVKFQCPVAEAGMKGMQPIQMLGSQITYMRRYLFFMAYEITDGDVVDALPPQKDLHPDKVKVLEDKIKESNSDLDKLLKYFGKENLEKFDIKEFKKCKSILDDKIKKAKEDKKEDK